MKNLPANGATIVFAVPSPDCYVTAGQPYRVIRGKPGHDVRLVRAETYGTGLGEVGTYVAERTLNRAEWSAASP